MVNVEFRVYNVASRKLNIIFPNLLQRLPLLESEDDLFRGLGLLSEDGLGLTSVSLLLTVVTPLALSLERILAFLVLRYFVQSVFSAFGRGAESAASFGDVHHFYAGEKLVFFKNLLIL